MKTKITMLLMAFIALAAQAQEKKLSPAETAKGNINGAAITINYGSPSVKGRAIWGGLVPFGQVWRAGANEATTFETSKSIMVEGKELPAGKYGFFILPDKESAIIIFNKVPNQWGAFKYDEKQDQLRVTVKPVKATTNTEKLLYTFDTKGLWIKWDSWYIPVNIK